MAHQAGVSMGTVSHYLNHPSRVSAEKAKRIQDAIDRLGFVRNNAGRQLRLGHSTTIAYIVPDVSNPFFATIAEGAEQRAAQAGLSMFIANSAGDPAREESYLDLFEEYGVRGMLVASPRSIEARLAAIRERGTPSVLVGRKAGSAAQPSVSIDDVSGGYLAARHLIEIGCGHIAFVGGPLGVRQVADRLQGASNAVREAGSVTLEVIDVEPRVITTGHKIAAQLIDRPAQRRPDGVFAVNDLLGIGLIQTLVTGGLRVPEDIAVVGYDDIEYAENSLVPLTSVRAPHEEFGIAALDLLLAVLDEAPAPAETHRVFAPDLVVRQSTRRGQVGTT
ncbi:substrate-binding domain-containing protein [Dactylosporangium sp. AC04546]|uniref:LacI family DNA-binding transcriptional regulator n=1 Tax=Dactylosporangium sp. AC04546 TaxID=2862460 RepID=UPI001EDFF0AB|nr:substrate-binding domain-containing protein [Dactylosporangium sp. AC04546]WVK87178.1 substrate-binding domain-containing protein [Dactylosporangium sp. AC04546]